MTLGALGFVIFLWPYSKEFVNLVQLIALTVETYSYLFLLTEVHPSHAFVHMFVYLLGMVINLAVIIRLIMFYRRYKQSKQSSVDAHPMYYTSLVDNPHKAKVCI